MASNAKKKTTMAKLAREARLRERRYTKQLRKDARRQEAATQAHGDLLPSEDAIRPSIS
jgi:hypothetical protein